MAGKTAHPAASGTDYPPPTVLREYSIIADGERGAVIGPRGDISWMCAPRWDSPSVFGNLIGGSGVYAIAPADRYVWGGYYEPGSLIWRSRWVTETGIVECREALAFPADPHRTVLLRRVEAVDGDATVNVLMDPRAGYGSDAVQDVRIDDDGLWHGRVGALYLRWSGAAELQPTKVDGATRWQGRLQVDAGAGHDLVLELSDRPIDDAPVDPDAVWHATASAWKREVPSFASSLTPAAASQSYAVLRGLTSTSGGMVAAATTSLPERAERNRSYDYRYSWIRDLCFTGQAVAADGPHPLLDSAVGFVTERLLTDGPSLMPAYTVAGERVPDQYTLDDLPGYPGGTNVVGNHVNSQFQLDAFGEALTLLATAARYDRLDASGWRAAGIAADAIGQRWQESDAGIWELEDRPWTHSRLIAAAGLRAIAAAGVTTSVSERTSSWLTLADTIVADTSRHALAASGAWQRSPDDPGLDGALLLIPLRGGLPPDDPRSMATLDGYLRDLTDRGYAYRFRTGELPLGSAEGAFQLCGFLVALAQHQVGRTSDAVRWFERTRAACGPPQLYSEEYDSIQNQLRGNLPQAFVHAFMIESSVRLAEAD